MGVVLVADAVVMDIWIAHIAMVQGTALPVTVPDISKIWSDFSERGEGIQR